MMTRLQSVLLATALVVGCGAGEEPTAGGSGLAGLLPEALPTGEWRVADGPVTYDSETLFEYLNGGAPLYLKHGFMQLIHVRYQLGDDTMSSVTLDVFDMGSPSGAFGLHRSGRPPEAEVRDWGAEGYRSGIVAAAWKGSIAIHAEADADRPDLIDAMEKLVAEVARGVTGATSSPAIINQLPHENRVPWSERIVAEDMMNHAFLPGGVLATYEVGGGEGTLFFSELADETAAIEAMTELRAHHEQWGEIVGEIDSIGDGGFRFSDPGLGSGAIIASGRYVAGAHGDLSPEVQADLLGQLVANLDGDNV